LDIVARGPVRHGKELTRTKMLKAFIDRRWQHLL